MVHLKYLKYLILHKWFVAVAGRRLGVTLWRLVIHDWSKFFPSEWFPYARYFYGNGGKAEFDEAWLKHQNRQSHHWQFWVLVEDSGDNRALTMPDVAVREMVADWAGAGRAIHGEWELSTWYEKNAHLMLLSAPTQIDVENLVRHFCGAELGADTPAS